MSDKNLTQTSYPIKQENFNNFAALCSPYTSGKDNGKVVLAWTLPLLIFISFFFIYDEAVADISKLMNFFMITLVANFGLFAGLSIMCFSAIKFIKEYMAEKTFKYWYGIAWLISSFILYMSFHLGMATT